MEHIDLAMPVGHSLQGKMVCSKTGAMMGIGVHGVAIIRALCGDEPIVVNATVPGPIGSRAGAGLGSRAFIGIFKMILPRLSIEAQQLLGGSLCS